MNAEQRIRELADGLEPVRPLPRLRVAWGAAVGLGVAAWALQWGWAGAPPLRLGASGAGPAHLATFAGLALAAGAALAAALAAAIPGREPLARAAQRVAAAGLGLAAAAGVGGALVAASGVGRDELVACVACVGHALGLGAAPAVVAGAFLVRGAPGRLRRGVALAVGGAAALGAAAIHATCANLDALHGLLGHTVAPLVAAALLTLPLAALAARASRRPVA